MGPPFLFCWQSRLCLCVCKQLGCAEHKPRKGEILKETVAQTAACARVLTRLGCEAAGENKINVHHDAVCVNLCEPRFRPSLSCTQSVKRRGEGT